MNLVKKTKGRIFRKYSKEIKETLEEKEYDRFMNEFGWILLSISEEVDKLEEIIMKMGKEDINKINKNKEKTRKVAK